MSGKTLHHIFKKKKLICKIIKKNHTINCKQYPNFLYHTFKETDQKFGKVKTQIQSFPCKINTLQ